MMRHLLGGLAISAVAFVLVARADDRAKDNKDKDKIDPKAASETAAQEQDRLQRQFKEFEGALLRLKQRLEASSRAEDKQKAAILEKAIKTAAEEAIDTRF